MKNLIRKILKESIDDFDWVQQSVEQLTPTKEFLYDLMSDLKMKESKKRPGWMVYKDKEGKILMVDDINTGDKNPVLYVDYDEIWVKLDL